MKTTISTAKHLMKKLVLSDSAVNMPVYMHSSPGLGKSAVVKQICEENDMGFVDVRLAQMEQSDVQGIPFVKDTEDGEQVMALSVPSWFPSEERVAAGKFPEKGILFFDEMSNAPIGVQHAAYRIILDREVHNGVKLAKGWKITAAGNLKEDKTGAKGVAPALANRFAMHLEITPSLEDFTTYAVGAGLDEKVIGFLNFDSSKLYMFDPKKNDVAFATPRSWEQVSNLLALGYSDEDLQIVLSGCVGDAVTAEFMAFRKYYAQLPDFEKIMDGIEEYTVPTSGDKGIVYALTSSLITNLVMNADHSDRIKNLNKVMAQLQDDFLIMVFKTIKSVFTNMNDASSDKKVSNILMNTMDSFKRVSKYVKAGDIS